MQRNLIFSDIFRITIAQRKKLLSKSNRNVLVEALQKSNNSTANGNFVHWTIASEKAGHNIFPVKSQQSISTWSWCKLRMNFAENHMKIVFSELTPFYIMKSETCSESVFGRRARRILTKSFGRITIRVVVWANRPKEREDSLPLFQRVASLPPRRKKLNITQHFYELIKK